MMDILKTWDKEDFGLFVTGVLFLMGLTFTISYMCKICQTRRLQRLYLPLIS